MISSICGLFLFLLYFVSPAFDSDQQESELYGKKWKLEKMQFVTELYLTLPIEITFDKKGTVTLKIPVIDNPPEIKYKEEKYEFELSKPFNSSLSTAKEKRPTFTCKIIGKGQLGFEFWALFYEDEFGGNKLGINMGARSSGDPLPYTSE